MTAQVGVLALQGDFREHLAVLRSLGADAVPVRREEDLQSVAGLVIPGGESSVMDKLSRLFGLAEPVKAAIASGMPVYGTCAGLIMLSNTVLDAIDGQQSLGGLDIDVRRNAFGSQTSSFEVDLDIPAVGDVPMHAVFIRAPVSSGWATT
jgi:5'-phosphate synthase pdxT subunit